MMKIKKLDKKLNDREQEFFDNSANLKPMIDEMRAKIDEMIDVFNGEIETRLNYNQARTLQNEITISSLLGEKND